MSERQSPVRTYHSQLGAVGHPPGAVFAVTTVVARVTRCDALNGQDTAPSAHLGYEDVLVVVVKERLVVERPADVQGQVALRQGALVGYVLAQMGGLGAGGEGRDLGQDLRETKMEFNEYNNEKPQGNNIKIIDG